MSSTERAPEPTMEEILASIRRIISDDEANAARADSPGEADRPVASDEGEEGAADTQFIDDLARGLSSANAQAPVQEEEAEEILDLTDLGMAEAPAAEVVVVEEFVVAEIVEEVAVEPVPTPSFAEAFPETPAAEPEPVATPSTPPAFEAAPAYEAAPTYEAAPDFETAPSFEPGPSFEPQQPPAAAAPPPAPEPAPPPEDPSVALERAIEALKAGDLAAFARAAESKYVPPAPPPMPSAAPPPPPVSHEPLPTAGPTLAEQFGSSEEEPAMVEEQQVVLTEPEAEPELEAEFTPGAELEPEPPVEEPVSWSQPEEPREPAAVSTPWHADDATWAPKTSPSPMPEYGSPARGTNGGSGHKTHDFDVASPKTLEDSVKEMLRPMLRKWLDENMQRVLTQALREELEDPQARREN